MRARALITQACMLNFGLRSCMLSPLTLRMRRDSDIHIPIHVRELRCQQISGRCQRQRAFGFQGVPHS